MFTHVMSGYVIGNDVNNREMLHCDPKGKKDDFGNRPIVIYDTRKAAIKAAKKLGFQFTMGYVIRTRQTFGMSPDWSKEDIAKEYLQQTS